VTYGYLLFQQLIVSRVFVCLGGGTAQRRAQQSERCKPGKLVIVSGEIYNNNKT